tara:strand:- start:99554 stop:101632 length:2079 start_codon:yes stop_codon:yes gene_type:complete
MSSFTGKIIGIFIWIWSHIAAAVALMLIVLALFVGYNIGSPSSKSSVEEDHADHAGAEESGPQRYTCSMHPSVRLEDPNAKCPICFMELIPVMERGGAGMEMRLTLSESARAMSRIETTKVGRFFPSAESRLFGKLVYDETSVARISAYFPGRIDRLFVNYKGVSVQQGDHLAELYSPDLLAAFEELRQAKNSLDQSGNASSFLRDTASQTLVASREKLRLFGLTQAQIEQVEQGNFDSDQLTIYSPIGGVVTHLAAREGDYLDTGDPIATVSNLKRLWLDLEAYESQLSLIRWGLPVTFTVEAHPGEVFEGRVSFIEPMVDERTRTAAVRVAVDNSDMRLKPGMFATAVIRAKVAADGAVLSDELAGKWVSPMHPTVVKDEPGSCDVCGMDLMTAESLGAVGDSSKAVMPMVIPRTAVLYTGTRSVVYVLIPDQDEPTYEGRTIELGARAGDYYTVRSGLNEGDQVVIHGAFRIDSAMQILAKPSMMMPNGGASGSGHNHGGTSSLMGSMEMKNSVPDGFIQDLDPVYSAYLDAQERLADDDLGGFLGAAMRLDRAIETVRVIGLVGESLGTWRRAASKLAPELSVTTMDDARLSFEQMSQAIMNLQDRFGNAADETIYTAFCPMAFDFKGAKWIQRGTEISNPYFGSEMLRCGDIQETHQSINRSEHDEMDMDEDTDMSTQMNHEEHDHD